MALLNSIALVVLLASCVSQISISSGGKVGNDIVEGVALPTNLARRLSPLSSAAISDYSAFLEDGSLAQHATEFCASAGIICSDGYNVNNLAKSYPPNYYTIKKAGNYSKVSTHSASEEDIRDAEKYHVYFREKELVVGGRLLVSSLANAVPPRPFLPKAIASRLPFGTSSLPRLSHLLGIPADSNLFASMALSLQQCETERIGEVKVCATSLEDMLHFAAVSSNMLHGRISAAGSQIQMLFSDAASTVFPQTPTFHKVTLKVKTSQMSVSCHDFMFPFALYYCHQTPHANVYEVSWTTSSGKLVRATAMCHMDTTGFDAAHPAFISLHIQPGKGEFCHWVNENNLVMWKAN